MALDDAGAALFVLEGEAHGRDPLATLTDGALRSRKGALVSAAMPAPPEQDVRPRAGRYRYDPLRRLMHRGSARLRHDVASRTRCAAPPCWPPHPSPPALPPTGPPPSGHWR